MKKLIIRKDKSKRKKNNNTIINLYIDKYHSKTINELIILSKDVFKQLQSLNDDEKLYDLNLQYNALIKIIDDYNQKNYKSNNNTTYYPDYYDSDFNEKIIKKKEFYYYKTQKQKDMTDSDKEELSKSLCVPNYKIKSNRKSNNNTNKKSFKLSNSQKFLKTFLSPNTPYNGMLLFHGTGVGKTCTSISIAETYTKELKKLNKKVIILLNPSIKANFIKNIFNINEVKKGNPFYQCTGTRYLDEIPDYDKLSLDVLEKKINRLIKSNYEFYGYQKFANIIEKIETSIKSKYDSKIAEKLINKRINKIFSNSVLIIDEAHNIKEGDSLKVLPPLLEKVVRNSDNLKLLLLSATPMFDNSKEIIWLINLLRLNDKKPLLKTSGKVRDCAIWNSGPRCGAVASPWCKPGT